MLLIKRKKKSGLKSNPELVQIGLRNNRAPVFFGSNNSKSYNHFEVTQWYTTWECVAFLFYFFRTFTVFFVHHTKKSNFVQIQKFCGFQTQGCDYSLVHNFFMVIYPTNLIQIKSDNSILPVFVVVLTAHLEMTRSRCWASQK